MKPKLEIHLKKKKLRPGRPEVLHQKDWIGRYKEKGQSRDRRVILAKVFMLLTIWLVLTFVIILLDGFHLWGFSLPLSEVRLLEWTQISELTAMGTIIVRCLFK